MHGYPVKQSSTAQPLVFLMIDSADHIASKTGLSPTVTLSKNGAAFASPAGAVTEIGSGWYKVAGNATDTATLGPLLLHATATGADPTDACYPVVAFDPQDAIRLGLTALPNAVSGAAGAVLTAGTGTAQLSVTSGVGLADVSKINAVSTSSVTVVNANLGTTQPVNYTGTGASALVKSDMVDIAGAAVSTSTAQIGVNVVNQGGVAGTFSGGRPEVNVTYIAGSIVSTSTAQIGVNVVNFGGMSGTFVSGRPDVNVAYVGGSALNTAAAQFGVNVVNFGGSAGTFAGGRPEVNLSHIAGATVSTSTAQLGVNVVNFGGSAGTFASGRPEVNTAYIAGAAVDTSLAQIGVNVVNFGGLGGTFTAGRPSVDTTHIAGNLVNPSSAQLGVNVVNFGGSAGIFAAGRPEVNMAYIAGAAVSTSTAQIGVNVVNFGGAAGVFSSGRPEVNTTLIAGAAVSTSTAQIGVNVVNFGGSAGTFAAGRPEVNTTHIAGAAVSTSTAQIGVNVVNWKGAAAPAMTGDAFARLGAPAGASVSADIANISLVTGAGDLTTKAADAATLTTGSTISGTFANTATDDDAYWITAPVTPAVGGYGLRQQLVFDLPLGRIPVSIYVRGWWNGSGQVANLFALNERTAVFDQLSNTGTNLGSRTNERTYSFTLPRDYGDSSGGLFNVVTLELRSTSTNTAHRLRLEQVLVAHISEETTITTPAPTAADIWTYVTRSLTTPGEDPQTFPPNFDLLAIDASGRIDVGAWLGDAPLSLTLQRVPAVVPITTVVAAAGVVGTVTNPVTVSNTTGYKLASDGLDAISTAVPSGVAGNFREMVVQTWRRFFGRVTKSSTEIKTYRDDETTIATTQAYTTGATDDVSEAS